MESPKACAPTALASRPTTVSAARYRADPHAHREPCYRRRACPPVAGRIRAVEADSVCLREGGLDGDYSVFGSGPPTIGHRPLQLVMSWCPPAAPREVSSVFIARPAAVSSPSW